MDEWGQSTRFARPGRFVEHPICDLLAFGKALTRPDLTRPDPGVDLTDLSL